jgi:hypothetical protein
LTSPRRDPDGKYENQRKATTGGTSEHQEGCCDGATKKDHFEVAEEDSNRARQAGKQSQKATPRSIGLTTISVMVPKYPAR